MTPKERDFVAALCAARAGLSVDTERPYVIESRMAALARRQGYPTVAELLRTLRDRGDEGLTWAVIEAMAPAQTAFFRDPQVFDALAREMVEGVALGASMRVWSAACGTGQEVYSLAMLLEERAIEEVELFASDLNERSLEKARCGVYSAFEAQQGLSARRLVRHFENHDDAFAVNADLRRAVRWRRMNLLEVPSGVGTFDVILCRNVLGALLPTARDRVLANLGAALRPGGRLILGVDEAPGLASSFVAVAGAPGVFERALPIRAAA